MAGMAALVAALVLVGAAVGAGAHDPLFLTEEQTMPETGPFLPDGTISFAIYGDLAGAGDTRGFQVEFDDGDRLLIEMLIPALSPEADLAEEDLPTATVVAPDGTSTTLLPETRERFDEPFSNTSYFSLSRVDATAMAGVYDVTITGRAPARFTIAVGTTETFFTPVLRTENRPTSFAEIAAPLDAWYGGAAAVGAAAPDPADASSTPGSGADDIVVEDSAGDRAAAETDVDDSTSGSAPETAAEELVAEASGTSGEVGQQSLRSAAPAATGRADGATQADDGVPVALIVVLAAAAAVGASSVLMRGRRHDAAARETS